MKSLSMRNRCVIGFTLFSMFFGAGNLIFPPFLGAEAGSSTIPAMVGMLLTAVVLPALAVISVAKHDGLKNLAGSIHPAFATVYAVLIHLLIGPFVAIPRTASTSFEMAVVPFLSDGVSAESLLIMRCIYSFIFFVIATIVALKPTRLKDLLGKVMTPILLILIAVIFVGVVVKFPTVVRQADASYKGHALQHGFVTGYQTMDILAAFSGSVQDGDEEYTESGLNVRKDGSHISEGQTKEEFHDNFNVLVVAEKYQTGFDEPLLHTMIVDKKLKNVKAVQTLSRLNRTCPGKVDTFVLDFANKKEDILEAFQPFYQETSLEQEVNVDLIYQTEKELLDYAIYNEHDINAFINVWNHPGKQDATAMGKMTSVLKPIADRYNLKNPEERYQFRRLVRKLIRWYSYITQVVRMFDEDMHKEYLFLSYLIGLLPEEKEEPVDLDGKLKLEYYKLQKTFEGAITLDKIDGQYVSSKKQGVQGNRQKSTLDEILDKINEKYKGQFSEGDRVMLGALHDKLIEDDKLASSARTSDPRIFTESIFPSAFGNAAMESYMEAQDSYGSLFEDKSKYDAVMSALAGVIYREMRSKKTVDYRKVERDEQVQMVAEEPVKYGK